jgi:hypothetical protein
LVPKPLSVSRFIVRWGLRSYKVIAQDHQVSGILQEGLHLEELLLDYRSYRKPAPQPP